MLIVSQHRFLSKQVKAISENTTLYLGQSVEEERKTKIAEALYLDLEDGKLSKS